MVNNCPICCEINGISHSNHNNSYAKIINSGENIIYENKYFSVIPSLGPLNNGHILIIPKRHILSFHKLNDKEINSLKRLKRLIQKYNTLQFNTGTEFFEHGTGDDNNYCGACISHAHLHSLPINKSINLYLSKLNMLQIPADKIYDNALNVSNGYLLVEDLNDKVWFSSNQICPSQILRQFYSFYSLNCNEWDWRLDPNISKVKDVIDNYKYFKTFVIDNENS